MMKFEAEEDESGSEKLTTEVGTLLLERVEGAEEVKLRNVRASVVARTESDEDAFMV